MRLSAPPLARAIGLLGFLLWCFASGAAQAQAPPGLMHGFVRGPTPIQDRLAQAQAAALATVESVEGGRIRLVAAKPVLGSVPDRFEVKRRPSAPLPIAAGDRVLLLLQGARSPYLAVDTPDDTLRIADDAAAARWTAGIAAVAAAHRDPDALLPIFLAWSESEDAALRAQAMRALLQFGGPFLPAPPGMALGRARVALDAARAPDVRRAAVALAAPDDAALDYLLSRVAANPDGIDSEVLTSILAAGLGRDRNSAPPAMLAALRAKDAELRLAAVGLASQAPRESVEPELAKLAEKDPDPRVREQAAHGLMRVQRAGEGS